jgi:ankyrin repeat protein
LSLLSLSFAAGATAASLPDLVESMQRDEALRAVAAGADVNERSVDGTTALQWAAYNGDLELVKLLIAHGADPKARNDYGMTAIAAAAVEATTRS